MSQERIIITIKKALYIWTGLCAVIFGIVSLVLPILPGLIVVILGLSLIAHGINGKGDWKPRKDLKTVIKTVKPIVLKTVKTLNSNTLNKFVNTLF